ncbi:MAG: N-acetylmuramic acid 6-phosphate etherase, partial [Clostridia bacterium]|nr:N-acetylmuramic acid 6-phosphate etherase [Clostridia bacterium]
MRDNYDVLRTEGRNPRTTNIDRMSTLEMVTVMNNENRAVEDAIDEVLPEIATAVDAIATAFENGGHLIYVGAGTSGRLGIIDAAECPPTFGVDYDLVRGIIAGGNSAVFRATENAEDDEEWGARAIRENGIVKGDVVCGLSAAGRAPFVLGAMKEAHRIGAVTVGITCNKETLLHKVCDITIAPYVGPEVISGSTRLKAGTAQKLVLNMLSTGAMVRTGKVYGNLMINVKPTNEKLVERATRILIEISACDRPTAEALIAKHGEIPAALKELG